MTSNTLGGEPVSFVRDLIWRNGLSWLIDSRRIKAKSRGTMTAKDGQNLDSGNLILKKGFLLYFLPECSSFIKEITALGGT